MKGGKGVAVVNACFHRARINSDAFIETKPVADIMFSYSLTIDQRVTLCCGFREIVEQIENKFYCVQYRANFFLVIKARGFMIVTGCCVALNNEAKVVIWFSDQNKADSAKELKP